MRYYVVSDVHGFYDELIKALTEKGFFCDKEPHKLVVAGDLFDRGGSAVKLQDFILELMARDEVILVRGNHEDLFLQFVGVHGGEPYYHHVVNGTYQTALDLTGMQKIDAMLYRDSFLQKLRDTPYYKQIIPAMINYLEIGDYIVTHGWVPVKAEPQNGRNSFSYMEDWRNADDNAWQDARWINGMDAVKFAKVPDKTIICGHYRSSYGHEIYEHKSDDNTPFIAEGIVAIDACTAVSGFVNCFVFEV